VTPDRLSSTIAATLEEVVGAEALPLEDGLPSEARVRRPTLPSHGDYTTNAALLVAGRANRPALELAGLLAERLRDTAGVRSAEVAPPGFVNLRVDVGWWAAWDAVQAGPAYGAVAVPGTRPAGLCAASAPGRQGRALHPRRVGGGAFGAGPTAGRHSDADPSYLVQRAHARAGALLRAGARLGIEDAARDATAPVGPSERALLRLVAEFPEVAGTAARRLEPRRLGGFLAEVAGALLDLDPRVLPRGDEEVADPHRARLLLVRAAQVVLANGLRMLGVPPAERW